MELKERAIEIRSEEIDEILGKTPVWILRRGLVLLLAIILSLVAGSWIFKYPDIISAPIIITTVNPPSPVIARSNGRITAFYVSDKQSVTAGEYLAVLENTSDIESIYKLKKLILQADSLGYGALTGETNTSPILNLGELQPYYLNWTTAVRNYERYIEMSFNAKKIIALQEQIALTNSYFEKLKSQTNLQAQNLRIATIQFRRDSMLFIQKVLPPADFEKSEIVLIGTKSAFKNSEIALSNTDIQINQLKQQVLELQLNDENDKQKLLNEISATFKNLCSQFNNWELNYVLKSRVDGIVSVGKYWSINQNIKSGDQVMTVVPSRKDKPLGKIILPMQGAGKVKVGQRVNIKLTNYPYIEYAMLHGAVSTISSVPDQGNYYVEVKLKNGLTTNYNKILPFSQEMTGTGEIITEDMRLLERLARPVYSIVKERMAE